MKSVIQKDKECYICATTMELQEHHIFFGTANRKQSEKHGLKVYLCRKHHLDSRVGVHFNKGLDTYLKRMAQKKFEQTHSRADFMEAFGRNYLEE